MGDQRLEWKIQEEEEADFSKSEESKMSMILSKGWSLGKKIVITGMAISSAPIVLPPLVIFSSIGFAVAVPFGFVFVSYACAEKLMSKLLSRPLSPPSLLEYKIYDDYVEDEEDFQENDGFRGEFMEKEEEDKEEKKFREDTKETLEMRIELIGGEKEDEEKSIEDMNEEKPVGVIEEESKENLYFDNYEEEEEKPGENMNGVMEEERADGTYVDNIVEAEEKPVEDMNGVMEEERTDGMYFDNDVKEEEKPGEDMNGVRVEERDDGTYFDIDVEAEKKPLEEYVGDTEEENLRRGTGGAIEDYREVEEEVDETVKEKEKPVEVISDEIEEEELAMKERGEVRDEKNADIVIEFEEGGVKENVGSIEEEIRPVRETEGLIEESRPEENVGLAVVEEEKPVLGMEGEKGEESEETPMPTNSSSLPRRKVRRKKGKKLVKKTAENMEEKERLVREAKGGIKDTGDEEPLDKLIGMDNIEEQNAKETDGEQNVSGMAQEKYIVGKELPSPQVEIIGVIEDENVSVVTQKDGNVEGAVPVIDVAQEGYNVEEAVPVLDTPQEGGIVKEALPVVDVMQEENMEEAPVVDVMQVGYIEKEVPVAEINGEEENVNDVTEEDYIAQQVVPVVEINGVTPVAEMNGVSKEENRDDENVGKIANGVEEVHGIAKVHEGVNSVLEPIRMKEERRGKETLDRVPEVEVKPMEEMGAMVDGTQVEEKVDKIGLTDTNAAVAEGRDQGITDRLVEEEKEPIVETEKKLAPSQTENLREVADESGLDVIDDEIADADQSYSYGSVKPLDHEVDSEPRYVSLEQVSAVKEPTAQNLSKEKADSAGHPLSAEMAESKFNKESHEQEIKISSKEVLYSEEKIWEQIDAMRKIVGYKAALQATCIEELKALYVFVGVEPPVAFRVPSDLAEINDKLRLLMSIIGVK